MTEQTIHTAPMRLGGGSNWPNGGYGLLADGGAALLPNGGAIILDDGQPVGSVENVRIGHDYTATQIHELLTEGGTTAPVISGYSPTQIHNAESSPVQSSPVISPYTLFQFATEIEMTATASGAVNLSCISTEVGAVQWEYNGQQYGNPFTETVQSGDVVLLRPGNALNVVSIDVSGSPVSFDIQPFGAFLNAVSFNAENSGAFGDISTLGSAASVESINLLGTNTGGTLSNLYTLTQLQSLSLTAAEGSVNSLSTCVQLGSVVIHDSPTLSGNLGTLSNLPLTHVDLVGSNVSGVLQFPVTFDGDVSLQNTACTKSDIEATLDYLAASAATGRALNFAGSNPSVLNPSAYGELIGRGNTVSLNWLPQPVTGVAVKSGAAIGQYAITQAHNIQSRASESEPVVGISTARKVHNIDSVAVKSGATIRPYAVHQTHNIKTEGATVGAGGGLFLLSDGGAVLLPDGGAILQDETKITAPTYTVKQSHQIQTQTAKSQAYIGHPYQIGRTVLLSTHRVKSAPTISPYVVERSRFPWFLCIGVDSTKTVIFGHNTKRMRDKSQRKIGVSNKTRVEFSVDIPHMEKDEALYLENWLKEYQDLSFAFSWTDNQQSEPQGDYDYTVELVEDDFTIERKHPNWFYTRIKLYGEQHFTGERDEETIN